LLSDPQEACVNKCADKFLKHSERVGARFGELSQQVRPHNSGG
jgi:import inner membrane translocase subunit TIM9